ncbi:fructose permease [Weissella paramesenteroides]|jgi:uncharacterized membrane protein YczE|uniref:fructose permease n=1 Tax=Weissella paramesenteroides TaxID=1249 RepID=UPI002E7BB946|nr:fructose permease [Weissella paramesenteroides]WPQ67192.1 fructose permease [Weissella paramesenteroides]
MDSVGEKQAQRSLSMSASIMYFIISLILNSLGNVLTLVTSAHVHPSFLGSAYWTAGEANLGNAILGNNSLALFWAFLVLGMLISFLNALLMRKLDWKRIFGNFIFMLPFSIFIQWFSNIFNQIMPDATTLPMVILYTIINFIGVALIATAISIYQRVNLVLHPADDLMQILRFKYFKGSAFKAMWASYIPPTIFAIIAFIITFPSLYNFGIGTLFAFLFQGSITGVADQYVFRNLHHQAIDVGK